MIGTQADAARALTNDLDLLTEDGSARIVYRHGDIVYKIDREYGANEAEWTNYQKIVASDMPAGIAIPVMTRYSFDDECVIAAEYISGTATGECIDRLLGITCGCAGACLSESEESLVKSVIFDTAWGNIIRSNGMLYIIDLEC